MAAAAATSAVAPLPSGQKGDRDTISSSKSSESSKSSGGGGGGNRSSQAKMVSSSFPTLDLLLLTFNCAKTPIHVPVFAAHLQTALAGPRPGNGSSAALPELVVFSLQEVAPLGHAFVGSYFLSPYLARFDDALTLAATRIEAALHDGSGAAGENDEGDETDTGEGEGNGNHNNDDSGGSSGNNNNNNKPVRPTTHRSMSSMSIPLPISMPRMPSFRRRSAKPYHLIRQANVGMTAIMVFARNPAAVLDVQVAECGFGVADMGNKGAVGLRLSYADGGADPDNSTASEITFVGTHLAPMEWNVGRRNANWRSIVAGLTFGNPRDVIDAAAAAAVPSLGLSGRTRDEAANAPLTPEEEAEAEAAAAAGDDAWLLLGQHRAEAAAAARNVDVDSDADADADTDAADTAPLLPASPRPASGRSRALSRSPSSFSSSTRDVRRGLHDISIFRPGSLLFLAGDLNYRTGSKTPAAGVDYPTTDADSWPAFLARDQLHEELRAGRTLHGLSEAPITFGPTYKYDLLDDEDAEHEATNIKEVHEWKAAHHDAEAANLDSLDLDAADIPPVPWKYARHRWPSWCDRILYLDVPTWTQKRWQSRQAGRAESAAVPNVKVEAYASLPLMHTSDHQPVYLRAKVPLLPRAEVEGPDGLESIGAAADGASTAARDISSNGLVENEIDPRIHLPLPIDADAWKRRARARRREWLAGCGMLLFNTPTGAVAMATVVLMMVGTYWVYVGWM